MFNLRRRVVVVPAAASLAIAIVALAGGCRPSKTQKSDAKSVQIPTPVQRPPVVVKTVAPEPPVPKDPVETALRQAGAKRVDRDAEGNIVALQFSGGRVTEDDMKRIASLSQLQRLYMEDMQVIDRDMLQVGTLANLQMLYLGDNHITDRGVEHLTPLKKLRWLSLEKNKDISDKSFEYLQSLESLTELNLRATGVTDEGVGRFKEALPKAEVYHLTIDPN